MPNGIIEPAWSWDHYKLAPDFLDMRQRVYDNRAVRGVNDFYVSPFKHQNVNTKRFKFAIVMIKPLSHACVFVGFLYMR